MPETAALAKPDHPLDAGTIEKVLLEGDLSKLTPAQRLSYYDATCRSLGLNPLTKPFDYLTLNGKLQLYARKDATEQLRKIHAITVTIKAREVVEGCYIVTAHAQLPDGRSDESIGAVHVEGLRGEGKANAMMKAETKAKRRVTLSICGLGMLDETEAETIPGATAEVIRTDADLARVEAKDALDAATVPPPEAARPALPDGQFWIEKVYEAKKGKKNGHDWTLFMVVVSTGQEFGTFDKGVASLADDCRAEECPAAIQLEEKTYGPQIVELVKAAKPGETLVL